MKLSHATIQIPMKRQRLGEQWATNLTKALQTPEREDGSHALGDAFKTMRLSLGGVSVSAFARALDLTAATVAKLERSPHRCGEKPLGKLLEAYGLAITLETPEENRVYGYPELHCAFVSRRLCTPNLTQIDLQNQSGVGRTTIQQLESGHPIKLGSLLALLAILEAKPLIIPRERLANAEDLDRTGSASTRTTHKGRPTESERPLVVDRYAPTLAQMLEPGRRRAAMEARLAKSR